MKKITLASIRKPLNLLLDYQISQSRFVEMLNEEVGFENEIIEEINDNIIYVDDIALNTFILDNFQFNRLSNDNSTFCDSDFIRIDLDKKEYMTIYTYKNNIITPESLYNILNK
jgi:hypothetical protein